MELNNTYSKFTISNLKEMLKLMDDDDLIKNLIEQIEIKDNKINELTLRLASIRYFLDSEISSKRYGEIKSNENE